MDKYLENIFTVPIFNQWLIYSPLYRFTALVNGQTVKALKLGKSFDGKIKSLSEIFEHKPIIPQRLNKEPLQPAFLGIISTRSCNLSCLYCGFRECNSSGENMDLSLAAAAVDSLAENIHRAGPDTLEVHFFGGEPFFAPDVVDVTIHRARARAAEFGLDTRFEVDTNGFFNKNRCRFIGDYIDSVVLSFDGPEEIQNMQRPAKNGFGSFNTVAQNAYYLSALPAELCFRVCVTQKNVGLLPGITKWFCDNFHPAIIDFEPLKPTLQSQEAGLKPPDPWEFAINFMKAHFISSALNVKAAYSAASLNKIQYSSCPVGKDALIVTPGGKVNACYLLEDEWKNKNLDLNMGYINSAHEMVLNQTAVQKIRRITSLKKRCHKCICRWHCAGGCLVNNFYANQSDIYDNFCIQTRIITSCLLLQEMISHNDLLKLLDDKLALKKLALFKSDRVSDWEE